MPAGTAPETPVRLRVEQVSSVEHAVALGVPVIGADGVIRLTAGLGRPLVLTTLEHDEAMRVLTEGDRRRPIAAAAAFVGGLALRRDRPGLGGPRRRHGHRAGRLAERSAVTGGDPRSSGQGPGLVGDPAAAIAAVVLIGVLAVVADARVRSVDGRPPHLTERPRRAVERALGTFRPIGKNCEAGSLRTVHFTVPPPAA